MKPRNDRDARRDAIESVLISHDIDYSPPGAGRSTFVIQTIVGKKEANMTQAEWYCLGLAEIATGAESDAPNGRQRG